MDEKLVMEAAQLEQTSGALKDNIEYIDSQIVSLEDFKESLLALESSEDADFLANIGPGVFVKSKPLDKSLFVQVGAGVIIKKSPEETIATVEYQLARIKEARMNILTQIDINSTRFNKIIEEISKQESEKEMKEEKA